MYVKYFSTKGDVTQSPFLVKLDITKLKRYLLGDHPFKTSAFFKGRGVPIADVCLLEGGRGLRNADVCNFYFFCQNIALNA